MLAVYFVKHWPTVCLLICETWSSSHRGLENMLNVAWNNCCRRIFIHWKHNIVFVRNHFLGITAANRNRLGRNFTGRRRVTWHATLLLAPSAKRVQNGAGKKPAFCNFFVSKTTHLFTHFQVHHFCEIWTQNVNRWDHESVGTQFWSVSKKRSLTSMNLILGFLGTLTARCSLGL